MYVGPCDPYIRVDMKNVELMQFVQDEVSL
jgi:hypothetical protein